MSGLLGHRGLLLANNAKDMDWALVTSLMHFNGPPDSTSITDEKGNSWTVGGTAKLTNVAGAFGNSELNLIGSGLQPRRIICSVGHQLLNFGTDDFCIELRLKRTSSAAGNYFIFDTANISAGYPALYHQGTGTLVVHIGGAFLSATNALPLLNVWYGLKLMRESGVMKIYVDGILVASKAYTTNMNAISGSLVVGNNNDANTPFWGYMDEFRITRKIRPPENQIAEFANA